MMLEEAQTELHRQDGFKTEGTGGSHTITSRSASLEARASPSDVTRALTCPLASSRSLAPGLAQPDTHNDGRDDNPNNSDDYDKVLLTPKNFEEVNAKVLELLPGETERTRGTTTRCTTRPSSNSLNMSGLPLHEFKAKVGSVLMLLRNLGARSGMCNATRFLLTSMREHRT